MESSFYYLAEDETYFLIIHRTSGSSAGFEKLVLSANEFGELITSQEQYISFVTEHGICIAKEHAVEMFMDVMPGLKVPKIRVKNAGKAAAEPAAKSRPSEERKPAAAADPAAEKKPAAAAEPAPEKAPSGENDPAAKKDETGTLPESPETEA